MSFMFGYGFPYLEKGHLIRMPNGMEDAKQPCALKLSSYEVNWIAVKFLWIMLRIVHNMHKVYYNSIYGYELDTETSSTPCSPTAPRTPSSDKRKITAGQPTPSAPGSAGKTCVQP